jgi:hypothetical protein
LSIGLGAFFVMEFLSQRPRNDVFTDTEILTFR